MKSSTSNNWNVEFKIWGREGYLFYHEGSQKISFYWELGDGDTIIGINVPTLDVWNKQYPLAIKRRDQILKLVGQELVKRHQVEFPNCKVDFDEKNGWLQLRER
jgi:hypothetical protein